MSDETTSLVDSLFDPSPTLHDPHGVLAAVAVLLSDAAPWCLWVGGGEGRLLAGWRRDEQTEGPAAVEVLAALRDRSARPGDGRAAGCVDLNDDG
ncbi:MAG: hypothetical protein R3236_10105, partial [Phycisphaeraceae bacterium]|nr:hypothetical protein [Phycisphaeraceae bacterium]